MTDKEKLHRLIEELPDNELLAARRFLEFLCWRNDPILSTAGPIPASESITLEKDRIEAARDPSTPARILAQLAEDTDQAVREAVAHNPQTPPDVLARLAMDADAGVRLGVARKLQASADAYRQATQAVPDQGRDVSHSLALSFDQAGRQEEALEDLVRRVEERPLDAEARCRLGNAYFDRKMYKEALAEFRKAAAINPQLTEPHRRSGDIHTEVANWDEAMREYQEVLKIEPNDPEAKRGLRHAQARQKAAKEGH